MILFILILLAAVLFQAFLPWWSIVPVSFIGALLLARSGKHAFWAGFLAVGLGWLAYALLIHWRTEGILTHKVSEMMSLPSPWFLFVLTPLIGGIAGGISAWAGYVLKPKRRTATRSPYYS